MYVLKVSDYISISFTVCRPYRKRVKPVPAHITVYLDKHLHIDLGRLPRRGGKPVFELVDVSLSEKPYIFLIDKILPRFTALVLASICDLFELHKIFEHDPLAFIGKEFLFYTFNLSHSLRKPVKHQ